MLGLPYGNSESVHGTLHQTALVYSLVFYLSGIFSTFLFHMVAKFLYLVNSDNAMDATHRQTSVPTG